MKTDTNIKVKPTERPTNTTENPFTVVAIGASVGGLEAVSSLLKNLPNDTGMAYIYVQHLNPDHKSLLPSILGKITKMTVQDIDNMEHIKPNNMYIIPMDRMIEVVDGHIKLLARPKNSSVISIDVLFTSLAETHKQNVIGIVLSGNAHDGTKGLKAIKDAGGLTFAQDDSAQAHSMPQSAIASGVVDYVLSPKEMGIELAYLSKNNFQKRPIEDTPEEGVDTNNVDLNTIFELLRKETGVDFSHYKMPTIKRRINHRMAQADVKSIEDYVPILRDSLTEAANLYKDLLINVTSFFRDIDTYNYLKTTLLPKLLKSKSADESLRIWVPACSTGEEAYSLAMLIDELQEKKTKKIPVQIFATDLSELAIRTARIGEYMAGDVKSLPQKYLDRYFTKMGDKYRIVKELRDMCIFAPHNILRDPSFSRMDFVSCCNLLIYFDSAAQKKVFATVHFALTEGGYLMLGKAETVGIASNFFTPINNKYKIYARKKNTGAKRIIELLPRFPRTAMANKKINTPVKNPNAQAVGLETAIDAVLLSDYMPACAVVNKDMEIVQFRGSIASYLQHPSGKASLNILKMAKSEFAFELRHAILEVLKTKETVQKTGMEATIDGVLQTLSFDVSPLKIDWDESLLLVVFKVQLRTDNGADVEASSKESANLKDQRIKKLTKELTMIRLEISALNESHETTYEELQAANEEIVSSNEEYQTLNEELETSKEELEVTNEELISTNHELQIRNDLLTEAQDYSEAIIATVHEPMLILDKNLCVKSANKSFYEKFQVKKENIEGQFLFDLDNKQWDIPALRTALTHIFSGNNGTYFKDFEITHIFSGIGEKTMCLNARLIVQKASAEKLILLAIQDMTAQKRYENDLSEYRHFFKENEDFACIINLDGRFDLMNDSFKRVLGYSDADIYGHKFSFFIHPEDTEGALKQFEQLLDNQEFTTTVNRYRTADGRYIWLEWKATFNDTTKKIYASARDITEQKRIKDDLEAIVKEVSDYRFALDASSIVDVVDNKGIMRYVNDNFCKISQYTAEELIGKHYTFLMTGYHSEAFMQNLVDTITAGEVWRDEISKRAKDGSTYWVLTTIIPFLNERGKPYQYMSIRTDITKQKRIENELTEAKRVAEEAQNKAEVAMQAKQQFLSNMSHEIRTPMNAMLGFTKVVLKTDLSAKQKEYVTAIKMSGDSLIVLINDILDLAKVDAGKMSFEQKPFKLATSIRSIVHLFETKAQEKNLQLTTHYDPTIPSVLLGDSVRLHQIILNLLSNALKFTNEGAINIHVKLLSQNAENVSVEFAISDTGIGIRPDKIDSIFENFNQAATDTSRLFGGTGLGLAIVKQLVKAQDGSIQVESVENQGSTFSFRLNFQKTNEEVDNIPEIEAFKADVQNINVLVVEDMALNQLLMKTILDDFGFSRVIADNGKTAINILKNTSFDIILMDLQMPEMNGFEATKYIRNTLKSNIPIIALTADVTTVDVEKCIAVGMNDYLAKPVDEQLLYAKIMGLVKKPVTASMPQKIEEAPYKPLKYTHLAYLVKVTKGNPSVMMELIEAYLTQTPPLIMAVRKSFEQQNWEGLHAAVHKMIPSFSIMGIDATYESMARKVMAFAREPDQTQDITADIEQLEIACRQACAELTEEFNTLKKSNL